MTATTPRTQGHDDRTEGSPAAERATTRTARRLTTGLAALALALPAVALVPTAQAATGGATPTADVTAVVTPTAQPSAAQPSGTVAPTTGVTATSPAAAPSARGARRQLAHWRLRGSCDHVYYTEIDGRLVPRSVFGGGDKLGEVESVRILRQAGFTWDEMQVALATMTAESERCPKAIGYNLDATGKVVTSDIGIWQINLKWHPKYASWDLKDPLVASRAAREIYLRSGWTAWNAYKYHDLHMNWAGWAITLAKQAGVR